MQGIMLTLIGLGFDNVYVLNEVGVITYMNIYLDSAFLPLNSL